MTSIVPKRDQGQEKIYDAQYGKQRDSKFGAQVNQLAGATSKFGSDAARGKLGQPSAVNDSLEDHTGFGLAIVPKNISDIIHALLGGKKGSVSEQR